MLKNVREYEISGIILAIIIIAMIIMVAIKSPTLEHVLLAGLIGVTTWYAYSTIKIAKAAKQQADASVEMAKEMKKQRYDVVRPVIDIQKVESADNKISEGLRASSGDLSWGLPCILLNIGLGPAVDVSSFVQDFERARQSFDFGTLAKEGKTKEMNLSLEQEDGRKAIVACYRDVYDRLFESSREVRVDEKQGFILGPLKVRPLPKRERIDAGWSKPK